MEEEQYWFTIWVPDDEGDVPHAYGVRLPDDRVLVWTLGDGKMSESTRLEAAGKAQTMGGNAYRNEWEDFPSEWRTHLSMQYVEWMNRQVGPVKTTRSQSEPEQLCEPDTDLDYAVQMAAEAWTPARTGSEGLFGRVSEGARGLVGKFRRPS